MCRSDAPSRKEVRSTCRECRVISGKDLGYSGMTFTTTGPDDGKIASVAKGVGG